MNSIEREIESLRERIKELEDRMEKGWVAEYEAFGEQYHFEEGHTVLWDTDDILAAIIINEDIVRKYLSHKNLAHKDAEGK
jgi:hypothetical protein